MDWESLLGLLPAVLFLFFVLRAKASRKRRQGQPAPTRGRQSRRTRESARYRPPPGPPPPSAVGKDPRASFNVIFGLGLVAVLVYLLVVAPQVGIIVLGGVGLVIAALVALGLRAQ